VLKEIETTEISKWCGIAEGVEKFFPPHRDLKKKKPKRKVEKLLLLMLLDKRLKISQNTRSKKKALPPVVPQLVDHAH
jgi:hypothetical protein